MEELIVRPHNGPRSNLQVLALCQLIPCLPGKCNSVGLDWIQDFNQTA